MMAADGPLTPGRLPPLEVTAAVSFVIPARGAVDTLAGCLALVLTQIKEQDELVVVAADRETADAALAAGAGRVRIVENPDGTTPAALNRGIAATDRSVVLRVDAQSRLPDGYRDRVVEVLATTGASVVGGRQVALAEDGSRGGFRAAVAAAMNSPFGHGGAGYRSGTAAGPVDTVYLGTFRRDVLTHVGGFDESFLTNQDAELNERIRRAGGEVWLEPELAVGYLPRDSVRALARQFRGYGRGRARTARRHRGSLRLRQLAAPLLVIALGATAALALTTPLLAPGGGPTAWTVVPMVAAFSGYGALLAVGARSAAEGRSVRTPDVALALATMHLAWGVGFLGAIMRPGGSAQAPRGRARR
jgi:GT2 family glycosyltransferase